MLLSEITSYVVLMSFYIKMMKRRTLQACSLRHSIKKGTFSCWSQAGGGVISSLPPLGYAPAFLGPKWSIFPQKTFLGKIIHIIFMYLLTNFIVPNFFFFFYNRSRVMRMWQFWTETGPICPNQNISENLLTNLVPIIHAYLHSKHQSQISIY